MCRNVPIAFSIVVVEHFKRQIWKPHLKINHLICFKKKFMEGVLECGTEFRGMIPGIPAFRECFFFPGILEP